MVLAARTGTDKAQAETMQWQVQPGREMWTRTHSRARGEGSDMSLQECYEMGWDPVTRAVGGWAEQD